MSASLHLACPHCLAITTARLTGRFSIRSILILIVCKQGREIARQAGVMQGPQQALRLLFEFRHQVRQAGETLGLAPNQVLSYKGVFMSRRATNEQ